MQPTVESVREFKVLTGTFSAEFGRGAGVVSVSTKSGNNELHGTAPLPSEGSGMRVDEKILDGFEQKRTESAAFTICLLEKITLQDNDKKILSQVLGIGNRVTFATDESENRPPIDTTELGERFARLSLLAFPID